MISHHKARSFIVNMSLAIVLVLTAAFVFGISDSSAAVAQPNTIIDQLPAADPTIIH
jgi:hypothetical protein